MTTLRSLASAALALAIFAPAARADTDFVTPREARQGKITACSKFGSNCYTAQLVPSPDGWKIRLHGGTAIDCAGDCQDTLRKATVDFWEDQRERSR